MAKKKSKTNVSGPNVDAIRITSPAFGLSRPAVNPFDVVPVYPSVMELYDEQADRRRFNPTRTVAPPAYRGSRQSTRLRIVDTRRFDPGIAFRIGTNLAVCARRRQRKEVLHALRIAGKRGTGAGRKRTNFWTSIRCR